MRESSKKRVLNLHNAKITTEEKTRLPKQIIHSCSLKQWTVIPMMVKEKAPIWQVTKQRLRIG